MQNKTIYIIILTLVAGGIYYSLISHTPATTVNEVATPQPPAEQNQENLPKLEANFSVPEGWYVNRTDGSILITKHETLPSIVASETYAYGDFITISTIPLNNHTPESWVKEQYPDEDPIFRSKQWATFGEYKMFEVTGGMSDNEISRIVFKNNNIVIFSLYKLNQENIASLDDIMESYFEHN